MDNGVSHKQKEFGLDKDTKELDNQEEDVDSAADESEKQIKIIAEKLKNLKKDDLCTSCGKQLDEESIEVGPNLYHDSCFKCHHCGERLTGKFYQVQGHNFCEKDKEICLDPCDLCGDLLREGSVVVAGKSYHHQCFCCSVCQLPIEGKFYTTDEGLWLCDSDYRDTKPRCHHCGLPILEKMLRALDKEWHPVCFRCSTCDISLDGVTFMCDGDKEDDAICKDCYSKHRAEKCDRCSMSIVSTVGKRTTYVDCQDKIYHQDCYTCQACSESLSGQEVFSSGLDILCGPCNTKHI